MLKANSNAQLAPFINAAVYNSLNELKRNVYPHFKQLFSKISDYLGKMEKPAFKNDVVYGSPMSNFIGNRVSWKLLHLLKKLNLRVVKSF